MRSSFVIAANLAALRFEISDVKFVAEKQGYSPDETKKLADAVNSIGYAESLLRSFRLIKKVEELPNESKSKKS